jgi:hypothetical protein
MAVPPLFGTDHTLPFATNTILSPKGCGNRGSAAWLAINGAITKRIVENKRLTVTVAPVRGASVLCPGIVVSSFLPLQPTMTEAQHDGKGVLGNVPSSRGLGPTHHFPKGKERSGENDPLDQSENNDRSKPLCQTILSWKNEKKGYQHYQRCYEGDACNGEPENDAEDFHPRPCALTALAMAPLLAKIFSPNLIGIPLSFLQAALAGVQLLGDYIYFNTRASLTLPLGPLLPERFAFIRHSDYTFDPRRNLKQGGIDAAAGARFSYSPDCRHRSLRLFR